MNNLLAITLSLIPPVVRDVPAIRSQTACFKSTKRQFPIIETLPVNKVTLQKSNKGRKYFFLWISSLSFNRRPSSMPALNTFRSHQKIAANRIRCLPWPFALFVSFALLLGGNLAIGHGDLELRIAEITHQLSSATNNPAPLFLQRAELHREHRNWEAAAADYDLAARANPKLTEVELCRARMLVDAAQHETALRHLDRLIEKAPDLGEAWILRGRARASVGRRSAAIEDYRHGLQKSERPRPVYFLELARLQAAENHTEQALQSVEDGLKRLGPESTLHAYGLELEEQTGNKPGALRHLNALVDLAQRKEAWLVKRGKLLLEMDRIDEARQSLEAALVQISKLPARLQKSPATEKLRKEIDRELAALSASKPEN
jgi:tetratricopeptide (TPR) repeat protein